MSQPDSIKEGWSLGKLWLLWLSLVAASVAVSRLLAFIVGRLFKNDVEPCEDK